METTTQTGDVSIINVPDKLDVTESALFKQNLDEVISSSEKIELDFTKTIIVSSAGIRILLQAEKSTQKANKSMTLKNVSPGVMEIFEITGVDKIFTIT